MFILRFGVVWPEISGNVGVMIRRGCGIHFGFRLSLRLGAWAGPKKILAKKLLFCV